jgi:hypothetical protein
VGKKKSSAPKSDRVVKSAYLVIIFILPNRII